MSNFARLFVLITLFTLSPGGLAIADLHDPHNVGQVEYRGPLKVNIKWSKQLAQPWEVSPSPVADPDGVIYAPFHTSADPETGYGLIAIRPDGKELWRYEFKERGVRRFSSSAISPDGKTVYLLIGYRGETILLTFNAKDGDIRLINKVKGEPYHRSRIVVSKAGVIYFVTESGLYASGPDGTTLWRHSIGGNTSLAVVYSPVLSPDEKELYVIMCCKGKEGAEMHFIASLDASTGKKVWEGVRQLRYISPYEIYATLAVDPKSGVIYATSMGEGVSGILYAFNPDGSLRWHYEVKEGDMSYTFPSVARDGTVYVMTGESLSNEAGLIAVDSSGRRKWIYTRKKHKNAQHPITIDKDGKAYFVFDVSPVGAPTEDTGLYCLDGNGKLVFKYHIADYFWGNPTILTSEGTIYIFSGGGVLYAVAGE